MSGNEITDDARKRDVAKKKYDLMKALENTGAEVDGDDGVDGGEGDDEDDGNVDSSSNGTINSLNSKNGEKESLQQLTRKIQIETSGHRHINSLWTHN